MTIKSNIKARPKWQQVAGGIAAIVAVLSFLIGGFVKGYAHFEKTRHAQDARGVIVAAHSEDMSDQADAYKRDRLDRHLREIRKLEYDLLDENLSDAKREWILRRIEELNATIVCIRADQC